MSVIGDKSKIDLDPKRDGYAYFKIAADPNIGASKVKVKVEAYEKYLPAVRYQAVLLHP